MNLTCDECGAALPSDTCEKCQQPAPLWAKFCPHCGNDLAPKRSKTKVKQKRQLCSDESCIGIIGENGLCTECGKRPTL